MNTQHTYAIAFFSIIVLVNGDWGNKDVSEERGRWQRQPINLSGQLTTYNDDIFSVNNISLNRQIKQIKLFALPKASLFKLSQDKPSTRIITKEPAKYLDTTNIDLVEVKKLEVPFPDILWIYEEEPGKGRKLEFIQLDITLSDGTKNGYLILASTKLYCDRQTHAAGPQEKDVPMTALKELTISSYTKNMDDEKKSSDSKKISSEASPIATTTTTPVA